MRFEKSNMVGRAVNENYWSSIRKTGRHVLALSVEDIAEALSHIHDKPLNEIKALVLKIILESPEPEDLNPEAMDIIFGGIIRGEKVFIWTVGDEGEYVDEEHHITYPAYDFQRRKIEGSDFVNILKERVRKAGLDPKMVDNSVSFDINAKDKISSLRNILKGLIEKGIKDVFVVDDQKGNIQAVEEQKKYFPEINIHTWWLNHESELGSLTRFKKEFLYKFRDTEAGPVALILDWDDTTYDEQRRMKLTIFNLEQGLK